MLFWVGILVGGLFAWYTVKMGFYETWAMLFNIVIAIYIALFLTPVIVDIIPVAGDTSYGNAMTLIAAAIGAFLILHGISYTFLTGQFSVSFPKIFDTLGTGLLGFVAGFLVWSFAGLLISITPISQNTFAKDIGFGRRIEQTNVPYLSWWCNLVNTVVSSQDSQYTTEDAINWLFESTEKKTPDKTLEPAEPNEPVVPNHAETNISQENQLRPPPVADVENIRVGFRPRCHL